MIFEQLKELVLPHLEAFENDLLVHDKTTIESRPGCRFLHWTRATGTELAMLPDADDECFPPAGQRVPFLFGTADREHILRTPAILAWTHNKPNGVQPLLVLYFNGKTLLTIDAKKAQRIAEQYQATVQNTWNREKRERLATV